MKSRARLFEPLLVGACFAEAGTNLLIFQTITGVSLTRNQVNFLPSFRDSSQGKQHHLVCDLRVDDKERKLLGGFLSPSGKSL